MKNVFDSCKDFSWKVKIEFLIKKIVIFQTAMQKGESMSPDIENSSKFPIFLQTQYIIL